jgi:hypothetical protein
MAPSGIFPSPRYSWVAAIHENGITIATMASIPDKPTRRKIHAVTACFRFMFTASQSTAEE